MYMLRLLAWIIYILILTQILGCASIPIDVSEKQFDPKGELTLPIDARAEIVVPIGAGDKKIFVGNAYRVWVLDDSTAIKNEGKKLFEKIFKHVESKGKIHDPHISIKVKSDSSIDTYWGKYTANVDVDILYGNGDKIGSYSASGSALSMHINDQNALDNSYKKAFIEIIEALIKDPDAIEMLQAGFDESHIRVTDRTQLDLNSQFSDLTQAVVTIIITMDEKNSSSTDDKPHGSGFFINSNGHILTNNHVVQDASSITVKSIDGTEYEADVVASDEWTDLALLKINTDNSSYLQIDRQSLDYLIGEEVIAIGSPIRSGFEHSISKGIISSIRLLDGVPVIQTDAALNPGSSGGPLIHLKSKKVIGMNTLGYLRAEGMGFALTLKNIHEFLENNKIDY